MIVTKLRFYRTKLHIIEHFSNLEAYKMRIVPYPPSPE